MTHFKQLSLIIIVLIIFFAIFKLSTPNKSSRALRRKMNNELNIGVVNLPLSFDPIKMKWAHEVMVIQALYQTLVKLDDSGVVVPDLSTKWEFSEDKKSITFFINTNAKFSDGSSVTSLDIAHSFARHFWPNSNSPVSGLLNDLIVGAKNLTYGQIPEGIIPEDNKITFTLNQHYFPFLLILSMPSFSIICWEHFKKTNNTIGSGPFYLDTANDNQLSLLNSKNYRSSEAKLNRLNFIAFFEKENAIPLMEKEDIDFIFYGVGKQTPPKSEKIKIKVANVNNPIFAHLFTNSSGVLGNDLELRKNLYQLLRTFAEKSTQKNYTQAPLPTLLPPGFLPATYYTERPKSIDPSQFKKIRNKKSQLKLSLLASDLLNTREFFEELKNYLSQADIELKYHRIPHQDFMTTVNKSNHNYDLILGGYGANIPDPDGILDPILKLSGWGYGIYNTDEEKKALESAKFLINPEDRQQAYEKIIKKFESKYLVIPLFKDHVQLIYRDDVSELATNYWYESEIWKLFWIMEK